MASLKNNIEKVSSNRYVEVSSTYRNRVIYPNVADFTVEVGRPDQGTNGLNSVDPIVDSFPLTTFTQGSRQTAGGVAYAGGTPGRVQLNAADANANDDFYKGAKIVDSTGEETFIQSYNAQSNTALLYFPFSADTWAPTKYISNCRYFRCISSL